MLQWLFTHLGQMRRALGSLFSCSDPVVEPEPLGTLTAASHNARGFGFAISCDGQGNLGNGEMFMGALTVGPAGTGAVTAVS